MSGGGLGGIAEASGVDDDVGKSEGGGNGDDGGGGSGSDDVGGGDGDAEGNGKTVRHGGADGVICDSYTTISATTR